MKGNPEAGKIGYIILWFLLVPVSALLLFYKQGDFEMRRKE